MKGRLQKSGKNALYYKAKGSKGGLNWEFFICPTDYPVGTVIRHGTDKIDERGFGRLSPLRKKSGAKTIRLINIKSGIIRIPAPIGAVLPRPSGRAAYFI